MGLLRATDSPSFFVRWAARFAVIAAAWGVIAGLLYLVFQVVQKH